jgi:hypothetical protein
MVTVYMKHRYNPSRGMFYLDREGNPTKEKGYVVFTGDMEESLAYISGMEEREEPYDVDWGSGGWVVKW